MLLLLLALSPAARAAICFAEWQCIFHYLDATRSREVSFDLRPLCGADDRVMEVTTPQGWHWRVRYAVCGNVSYACNPYWPHAAAHGQVVQDLLEPPPGGATTLDPDTGETVAATDDCEVLGHTRPEFDLLDEADPARGGIVLRHSALAPSAADKYSCEIDTRTGYPRERAVSITILCDEALNASQVAEVAFFETAAGSCEYNLTLRSGAACGVDGDPFSPPSATPSASATASATPTASASRSRTASVTASASASASPSAAPAAAAAADVVSRAAAEAGLPATNAGYTVLGCALALAAQAAWARLRRAGGAGAGGGAGASGGAGAGALMWVPKQAGGAVVAGAVERGRALGGGEATALRSGYGAL
jgi:hypothetical protein